MGRFFLHGYAPPRALGRTMRARTARVPGRVGGMRRLPHATAPSAKVTPVPAPLRGAGAPPRALGRTMRARTARMPGLTTCRLPHISPTSDFTPGRAWALPRPCTAPLRSGELPARIARAPRALPHIYHTRKSHYVYLCGRGRPPKASPLAT